MRALRLCLFSVAVLAGCTKQEEKVVKDEPKKSTPVTSADLGGFNDFLPQGGGGGSIAVKLDGGLEGGIADVPASGAGAGGGGEAPAAAEESKLKVTEAGGDPKAVRRYAFAANRVDKRLLTIQQEQQRGGQRGGGLTLSIAMDFTPKKVEPKGAQFELKVTKVDLPGAAQGAQQQAQLAQALAGLNGLTGSFVISPRGAIGEVAFAGDQKMQNPLAEGVVQGISQVTELLVPAFPDAPIGPGAKWERNEEKSEGGIKQSVKAVYTLKEVAAEGGIVDADIEIKVPKRAVQARGVPPGTTVAIDGKGHYTYTFRFDRLATKVVGELKLNQHIEATDEHGKKQAIDDVQIAKQTIDTPAGGGGGAK